MIDIYTKSVTIKVAIQHFVMCLLTIVFWRLFPDWRQVKNLAKTPTYLKNCDDLVLKIMSIPGNLVKFVVQNQKESFYHNS